METEIKTSSSSFDFKVPTIPNVQIVGPNELNFPSYLEEIGDFLSFSTSIFYLYIKKVNLLSLYFFYHSYFEYYDLSFN